MMVRSEAQRLTRMALGYGAGFVVMMAGLWLFNTPNSGSRIFFGALGIFCAPFTAVYALRASWATTMGGPEREAIAATEGLPRRHFFKGTGIALDTEKRELHLFGARTYRRYALADVRTWERRQQTGGVVVGQGLAVVAANAATAANNASNSGLFIEVRDIDYPLWRIAFPRGAIARELPRWMEALQQAVNETPGSPSATPR